MTCSLLVLLLALVVGLNGFGSFYTDIKPEVYLAPWDTLGRYLSGWTSSPYLGSANFNVGLAPVLLVVGLLRFLGLDPEWSFKVFHFALWLCAAWGANRLLRALVPSASRWAALAAGVVYIANPYQLQAGVTLAILLPMALLPWLLVCLLRALEQPRGWTWPAACGLIFAGMSGMNVAVVPIFQLGAVLPILVVARLQRRMRIRDLALVTGKCALWVLGLSLYWLVPARAAVATGRQIVLQSETLDGIAKVSSFPEILRGLGMWPLYGSDSGGPWVPQDAVFIVSTVVVVLTILWPVLSLLSLRYLSASARWVVVGWIAIAAVVMVGIFPGEKSQTSAFGVVLHQIMTNPAASAFRTTNKIGAVLALAFAVALGVGADHWARRVRERDGLAPIAGSLAIVLLAAWSLPALSNRLYVSQMNIPGYWKQAAAAADKGNPDSRVLFLPGQVRPSYRWTGQRPDDLPNSLLSREAVLPETSPNASAPGGNYLAAMDDALQSGVLPDDAISTYARYLGIDKILLRHDTAWEADGGARPAQTDRVISADPGLFGEANFGEPGEFVFGNGTDAYANGEGLMYPVQMYAVKDSTTAVRARSDSGSLVVAGDGWSVSQLTASGQLRAMPGFRYASQVNAGALPALLGSSHGLVITDTNARRDAIPNRLTNGEGALLTAATPAPNTRALGTADDQTVLVRSGATVTATDEGGAFFDLPYATPENLLDGDPSTSWLFGDFQRAVGQSATITEPTPITVGKVRVQQSQLGGEHINELTVTAGGRSITQKLPDKGYAEFDFGSLSASEVKLSVKSLRGSGYSLVGISDVQMAGPKAIRTARTPITFSRLYNQLSATDRAAFDRTPLNVLLSRYQGTSSPSDDAETGLRRIVTLPDQRTFNVTADARFDGDLEKVYDLVAGYPSTVSATSSDFYFRNGNARASMAADGRADTAWSPGGTFDKSWWQLTTPARSISKITIDQRPGFGASSNTQWASAAVVTVDGKQVARVELKENASVSATFPAVTGKTVRVTMVAAPGPKGPPARFATIDTGYTMKQDQPGPLDAAGTDSGRCLVVGTVDGQPIRMRPATETLADTGGQGTQWEACSKLTLGAGEHRIEQAPGFVLDGMQLKDTRKATTTVPVQPTVQITDDGSAAKAMKVTAPGAFNVVVGQSYDERWIATANGKSLGKPTVIDGYSTGWRIPKGGSYEIKMSFAPQRASYVAMALSALVLLAAVALIVVGALRRRKVVNADLGTDTDTDVAADPPGRPIPRVGMEVALVLVSAFFVGWSGLVAGAVVVAALRSGKVRPAWLVRGGAALVLCSIPLYLLLIGDARGTISADAVARSLWPHYLAGAGLVLALAGALAFHRVESEKPE
ncbi:alpha-(1-_3)-arabinofuranosyltransferase domain-containing protein [Calidifontibacter terrae]